MTALTSPTSSALWTIAEPCVVLPSSEDGALQALAERPIAPRTRAKASYLAFFNALAGMIRIREDGRRSPGRSTPA